MWFYEISLLRGGLSLHPARSAYLLAVWYLQVCLRLLFLNMRIGEGGSRTVLGNVGYCTLAVDV